MSELNRSLTSYRDLVTELDSIHRVGRVTELVGLLATVQGLQAELGELCLVEVQEDVRQVFAEVVGFQGNQAKIMPLGDLTGIGPGTKVHPTGHPFRLRVGPHLLGQVLDGLGYPLNKPMAAEAPLGSRMYDTTAPPPGPLTRTRITERLPLGVRALDALIPCGRGQRLGIFAGSGVGKSSLLGMIARYTEADVNVICLVGERGREVKDFIERDLGAEGLKRSIVVAATSDQSALVRIKAPMVATTIAEFFRDQGSHVLLMMDSVTRFAMAQREVGLTAGEPPATRGYPPSVWAMLPRILERAGSVEKGSITGLYTVLVEGDDMNEPIADAARAILDGHIVLDRNLAHRHHYPAIDILQSVSRLSSEITSKEVQQAAAHLRQVLARYRDKEDMISIGAYNLGSDPIVDYAIKKMVEIEEFLQQLTEEGVRAEITDQALIRLMEDFPSLQPLEILNQDPVNLEESSPLIPTLNLAP